MERIPFLPATFPLFVEKFLRGEVAIFPSDTSYGFSGLPEFPEVTQQIWDLKKRVPQKPFLLLVADTAMAEEYGAFSPEVKRFARERWEQEVPTTLIVPKTNKLADFFPETSTVGLRVPADLLLRQFLHLLQKPLISTSANVSGEAPIFSALEIMRTFGNAPLFFADAGDLPIRPASEIWADENGILRRIR